LKSGCQDFSSWLPAKCCSWSMQLATSSVPILAPIRLHGMK
jgi:hypothetical protein